jgi:hypothetical protein
MDERAHQDVAAAAAVHAELGHTYDGAVAEGLVDRISAEIDRHVDARLAQHGRQPGRAAWANVALGLGSAGLGLGATAVTLHASSVSGAVPKAALTVGPLHGSVMTATSSVSTGQLVLVALIWAVIAVINIAYARRPSRRP